MKTKTIKTNTQYALDTYIRQQSTNNVNKTSALLQTIEVKKN